MTRFLLSLSLVVALVFPSNGGFTKFFRPGEASVVLGDKQVTLTKETSCKAEKWGGSEEVGCRCCILKHALKKDGAFEERGDHVTACVKERRCSPEALKFLGQTGHAIEDDEGEEVPKKSFRVSGLYGNFDLVKKVVAEARPPEKNSPDEVAIARDTSRFKLRLRSGEAAVTLGGKTRILTKSTSCKAEIWGPTEGCRCCILKHALKPNGTFDFRGDHVTACIKEKRCTRKIADSLGSQDVRISEPLSSRERHARDLASIFGEEIPKNDEDQKSLTVRGGQLGDTFLTERIVKKSRLIAPLGKPAETQGKLSNLTTDGVKSALVGLIPESEERINQCMTVKTFGSGGAQTDQLFGVFTACGELIDLEGSTPKLQYIVKGLKKISESRNLEELKRDFAQYNLLNPRRPRDFPAIAMSLGTGHYFANGKLNYITVMPAAPGKPLYAIAKEFIEKVYLPYQKYRTHIGQGMIEEDSDTEQEYKKELEETQKVFSILGDRLGRFHEEGMTKDDTGHLTGYSHNVHGDFHSNNVFYGIENEEPIITFIDPETLVISFKKPRDVAKDLRHFYLYLTLHFKNDQNVARLVTDKNFWHEAFILPFLEAYVKAYAIRINSRFKKKINWSKYDDAMSISKRALLSISGSREDIGQSIGAIPYGFWSNQRTYIKVIFEKINQSIRKEFSTRRN